MSISGTPRTQVARTCGATAARGCRALDRAIRVRARSCDRHSPLDGREDAQDAGRPRFRRGAEGGWVLGYELVRLAREADPHRRLVDAAYAGARSAPRRCGRVRTARGAARAARNGDPPPARRRAACRCRQLGRRRRAPPRLVGRQADPERARRGRARRVARRRAPRVVHGPDDRRCRRACAPSLRGCGASSGRSSSTSSRTASRRSPFPCGRRTGRSPASSGSAGRRSGSARTRRRELLPRIRAAAAEIERALADRAG